MRRLLFKTGVLIALAAWGIFAFLRPVPDRYSSKVGAAVAPAGAGNSNPEKDALMPLWQPRAPALVASINEPGLPRFLRTQAVKAVTPVALVAAPAPVSGQRWLLPLPAGRQSLGTVNLVRVRGNGVSVVGGRLDDGGSFVLALGPGVWSGVVMPADGAEVFRLFRADDGGAALASVSRDSVLCVGLPRAPGLSGSAGFAGGGLPVGPGAGAPISVPLLESRPEAEAVVFLDFDGATVTDPFWNGGVTIQALESGLGTAAITSIWRRVAEDYRPFAISVTTDPARYAAARPMQRMRCIITASSDWFGDFGGVAGLQSWPHAGVDTAFKTGAVPYEPDVPCWAFSDQNYYDPDSIALAVSHEVGHTLGLRHDGLENAFGVTQSEYYAGHGSGATSWGPIMGAPYGRALIQWNDGDYMSGVLSANNPEDDLAIIAGIENHTGWAPEFLPSSLAEAGRLALGSGGATVEHSGVITAGGREAWLLLAAGAGPLSLSLVPEAQEDEEATNFDGSLTLTTLAGQVLGSADNSESLFPNLSLSLPASAMYVLRVKSVGRGTLFNGGYSDYGSVGRFRVQGSFVAPSGVAPVVAGQARIEGRKGDPLVYFIEAGGADLSYTAAGLPAGLSVDASGRISGVPAESGAFSVTVGAVNAAGASQRTVVMAVAPDDLASVLDAPGLSFSTGGDRPWHTVAEIDAPVGGAAARSGVILDDFQTSWIETTLTGPGRLTWRWKVSSEADYDFFRARVDGAEVASISGERGWTAHSVELAAGSRTVRWIFEKDPFLATGEDAAWLDEVRWARGFELWAEGSSLAGPAAAAEADADGDGVANLLEYALDRDPALNDGLGASGVVEPSQAVSAPGALELAFTRPAGREDVRHVVEVSADLITWTRGHVYGVGVENTGDLPTVEVSRIALPGGGERLRVRDAVVPGLPAPRRFIRLRIETVAP